MIHEIEKPTRSCDDNVDACSQRVDLGVLASHGSLFLTRPSLMHYTARREDLLVHAEELFEVVARKAVVVNIGSRFKLAEAAEAHRQLEARKTTGSSILLV